MVWDGKMYSENLSLFETAAICTISHFLLKDLSQYHKKALEYDTGNLIFQISIGGLGEGISVTSSLSERSTAVWYVTPSRDSH